MTSASSGGAGLRSPSITRPPRPAEDRRVADDVDAAREQSARERVALEPLVLLPVEREADRSHAIDPRPALGETPPAHAGGASPIRYVATNRCVAVSRTALNHR